MDSITHTVLGACTGELIAGRKIGKKAMLIGALANNVPDLDMVSVFWTTETQGLLTHRGLTHSFFFAVLILPVLIHLFRTIFRRLELPYPHWMFLVGHGLILHIVMDSFTTYGTGWFEPFSHYRVSFNLLFILDPVILILFLIGCISLLIMKTQSKYRTRLASVFLIMGLCYLLMVSFIKFSVNNKIQAYLKEKTIEPKEYMFCPTPLNCILWYINIHTQDGFLVGYYSIFDKQPLDLSLHSANQEFLKPVEDDKEVGYLKRFTKGYYAVEDRLDTLVLHDTRFGQTNTNPESSFFFTFYILRKDDQVKVKQAEFRKMKEGDLGALYQG